MAITILGQGLSTVGEIIEALSTLPEDATLTPFGVDVTIAYDDNKNEAYMDEPAFIDGLILDEEDLEIE